MKELKISNVGRRVNKVRNLMRSVGNSFGSCWFYKRSDQKLRKMAYRLHVYNPTYVRKPNGGRNRADERLITVFDANTIRYNKSGRMCGRGGYKCIPLENVVRLKVNGEIYKIKA